MDIKSFKTKVFGSFTARQLVCVVISAVLDLIVFLCIIYPQNIPVRPAIFALAILDVPILAFTVEPMGIPMEVYFRDVWLRNLLAPVKRKAISGPPPALKITYPNSELKKSKKRMKKARKKNPEFRAYK